MSTRRSYDDACAAAHALDLIGERWALLVVRELVLGPKRFTDLKADLPGISPNVLTQRLEALEEASVVHRHRLPPPASAWVYELSAWGLELEPVIQAMGRWAARSPTMRPGLRMGVDSLILSMRTMFDKERAAGVELRLEFRFGARRFHADIRRRKLTIARGASKQADAVIDGEAEVITGLLYGGAKLSAALRSGALKIQGDKEKFVSFLGFFPLPDRAPALPRASSK